MVAEVSFRIFSRWLYRTGKASLLIESEKSVESAIIEIGI